MCFAALWPVAPPASAFDRRGARVGLRGGMRRHVDLRPLPAWRRTDRRNVAATPTRTHWPVGAARGEKKYRPTSRRRGTTILVLHAPSVELRGRPLAVHWGACSAGPDRPRCPLAPALRTTSVPCTRSDKHTQHRGIRRAAANPPDAAPASPWAASAAFVTVTQATRGAAPLPAPGPAGASACNVPHPPPPAPHPRDDRQPVRGKCAGFVPHRWGPPQLPAARRQRRSVRRDGPSPGSGQCAAAVVRASSSPAPYNSCTYCLASRYLASCLVFLLLRFRYNSRFDTMRSRMPITVKSLLDGTSW